MSKTAVNIKIMKKCAFCKYWYDPTNSAINPKAPKQNLWEYENNVKCKCLKRNTNMLSSAYCHQYECKLDFM